MAVRHMLEAEVVREGEEPPDALLGTRVGDGARRNLPPTAAGPDTQRQPPYRCGPGNAGPTPRLTSVIAANDQLPEGWPSSGQMHRRAATYKRSLHAGQVRPLQNRGGLRDR